MSVVGETVNCSIHGETQRSFVCTHLLGESTGMGFNRRSPSDEDPFPDAWCDNCEIIRAEHGDWDNVPEHLQSIALLCSGCYERARIRNTCPTVTLNDLAGLRWKCGGCDEWHAGPLLDLSFDQPVYWASGLTGEIVGVFCHPVKSTEAARASWMRIIAPSATRAFL